MVFDNIAGSNSK